MWPRDAHKWTRGMLREWIETLQRDLADPVTTLRVFGRMPPELYSSLPRASLSIAMRAGASEHCCVSYLVCKVRLTVYNAIHVQLFRLPNTPK